MIHKKNGGAFRKRRERAPKNGIRTISPAGRNRNAGQARAVENNIVPGMRMELTLDTLVPGGKALARPENSPVAFVDKGIPGQRVEVEVTEVKSGRIEARRVRVLRKAEHEAEPFCPHFFACGGCAWQELPYSEQLSWKRAHVRETLRRIGGIDFQVPELVASPALTGFRNKMEFAFGTSPEGVTLGLRRRNSREIEEVRECPVAAPGMMPIVNMVRDFAKNSGLPAWDETTHSGFWRFLVVRSAGNRETAKPRGSEETALIGGAGPAAYMIHIITGTPETLRPDGGRGVGGAATETDGLRAKKASGERAAEALRELAAMLKNRFPAIASVLHGVRDHPAQFAVAERTSVLSGEAALRESISGLELSMSGDAFFQTNAEVTPLLHDVIKDMAGLTGTEHVFDLFCGTGAIGLSLAGSCRALTGIETVAAAARDAARNALANNIANAEFIAGDAVAFMKKRAAETSGNNRPDVVIADPPRAGLGKELVNALTAMGPEKLILVSCDAATMARDLSLLIKGGYALRKIQALDMFPHTPHMECCCLLARNPEKPRPAHGF